MVEKIARLFGGSLRGKRVAVLGLTFKPNTDDMRDAPSIDIIKGMKERGANVVAFDPAGMEEAKKVIEGIEYVANSYDAAKDADGVVIITEWNQFRHLDAYSADIVHPIHLIPSTQSRSCHPLFGAKRRWYFQSAFKHHL